MSDPIIRKLEARIADLERRLPAGGRGGNVVGGGTQFGQLVGRTIQPGFRGHLTGIWTTTGYPWARDQADMTAPAEFVTPTPQPTNLSTQANAISVDGVQTYGSGMPGWFEPSPDGSGYIFLPSGAGSGPTMNVVTKVCFIYGTNAGSGSGSGSGG